MTLRSVKQAENPLINSKNLNLNRQSRTLPGSTRMNVFYDNYDAFKRWTITNDKVSYCQ